MLSRSLIRAMATQRPTTRAAPCVRRQLSTRSGPAAGRGAMYLGAAVFAAGTAFIGYHKMTGVQPVLAESAAAAAAAPVDINKVRADLKQLLETQGEDYDDGSYGPLLVRLAWHASGTFCKHTRTGGSDGGTMRFAPESQHGANAGLEVARQLLEPIKAKYPGLSYADLYVLAGIVAIESMDGPKIPFRPGRSDAPAPATPEQDKRFSPDGRLPDAAQGAFHVRDIFYRMGFNDQEIVALVGAHSMGRCHKNRSGFDGPWTRAPTTFSNLYFKELLEQKWVPRKWSGPKQFADEATGDLMMLPADIALIEDLEFRKWVEIYARDGARFSQDFAAAFYKLTELGVNRKDCPKSSGWGSWFGGKK